MIDKDKLINEIVEKVEEIYPHWHISIHPDKYYDILLIRGRDRATKEVYCISLIDGFKNILFPNDWCSMEISSNDPHYIMWCLGLVTSDERHR